MKQLNLKVLVPMYFEEKYEELCERADGLGMDSLTEDEQYFVDTYHRLDDFISHLSPAEVEELENVIDDKEILELQKDMFAINPDKFCEIFNATKEDLINKGWNINKQ